MPEATKANNRALALVYATIFLDVLGLGILIPVLPYFAQQYRTDALTVGFLSAAFSIAQFMASPFLGALSDRIGRRPVILFNIFGSSMAYFLFGWASTLWLLMLARVLEGITGGSISTAQAYIADVTPPEDRMKRFGMIGAVFGLSSSSARPLAASSAPMDCPGLRTPQASYACLLRSLATSFCRRACHSRSVPQPA